MNEEITKRKLLDLKMHDTFSVSPDLSVRRVFGGWLYEYWNEEKQRNINSTFVPDPRKFI